MTMTTGRHLRLPLTAARVVFHLSGPLRVEVGGNEVTLPRRRATQRLLVWTLLNGHVATHRARAAQELWPTVTVHEARSKLRRQYYYLGEYCRRQLGIQPILSDREQLLKCVTANDWVVDLWQLRQAIALLVCTNDEVEAEAIVRAGLACFPESLLPDWDDDWLLPHRLQIMDERDHLLMLQRSVKMRLGDQERTRWAIVSRRPSCFGSSEMGARGPDGWYNVQCDHARSEAHKSRSGKSPAVPVVSPYFGVPPKDGSASNVDVCGIGISRLMARLHSTPSLAQDRYFDANQVDEFRCQLGRGDFVTVVGECGIGKTRFVHEVLALHTLIPGNRYYWIDAPVLRSGLEAWCSDVVSWGQSQWVHSGITAHYPSAYVIVVVDGCDGVTETVIPFVEMLRRSYPDATVVATCRNPVGVAGERVTYLHSLRLNSSGASEDCEFGDVCAGALFQERAGLGADLTVLRQSDLDTIHHLLEMAAGVPLLVEHLAHATEVLSLAEVEEFAMTACVSIGYSYPRSDPIWRAADYCDDMSLSELVICYALYEYQSGVSFAEIRALCDAVDSNYSLNLGDVCTDLDQLIAGSAILVEASDVADRRVRLSTHIRVVLSHGMNGKALRNQVRSAFARIQFSEVEHLCQRVRGERRGVAWSHLMKRMPDLRHALAISSEWDGNALRSVTGMIGAMWRYWAVFDDVRTERAWIGVVAAKLATTGDSMSQATTWHAAGILAYRDGDVSSALACYERCVFVCGVGTDIDFVIQLLVHQAAANAAAGSVEVAERCGAAAVKWSESASRHGLLAEALRMRAEVIYRVGRMSEARELLSRASRVMCVDSTDGVLKFRIVQRLGSIAQRVGEYTVAREWFQQARKIALEEEAESLVWSSEFELAQVLRWQGELEKAKVILLKLAALHRATGRQINRLACLISIADIACDEDDIGLTRILLRQARRIDRAVTVSDLRSDILNIQTIVAMTQGDERLVARSVRILQLATKQTTDVIATGWSCRTIGQAMLYLEDTRAARDALETSVDVFGRSGSRGSLVRTCDVVVGLLVVLDRLRDAAVLLGGCDTDRMRIGAPRTKREIRWMTQWREGILEGLGAELAYSELARGGEQPLELLVCGAFAAM